MQGRLSDQGITALLCEALHAGQPRTSAAFAADCATGFARCKEKLRKL